ncbi:uncharacterized protein B0I36DRAFT_350750 [Microdochium trichocladiopsis]|uniref:Uncharacterized protein n=1 Tax=Microdochium trichocladiopsis TaxID=1682393 RepID=A0A9P8Y0Y0_9PEZI|nr:uncharacterized protein B0I36DRAFT_350750 [Microdochium trichocladiopsis]KAH7027182.1 hypothetical protein B0I36DRAFT_350750 [Microdochium trichocladiopsis]
MPRKTLLASLYFSILSNPGLATIALPIPAMKLSLALIPLLSLGITAAPVEDAKNLGAPVTPREDANILDKRDLRCKIVGADEVNCRKGYYLSTKVVRKLKRNSIYTFDCFHKGGRVIIDGVPNSYVELTGCIGAGAETNIFAGAGNICHSMVALSMVTIPIASALRQPGRVPDKHELRSPLDRTFLAFTSRKHVNYEKTLPVQHSLEKKLQTREDFTLTEPPVFASNMALSENLHQPGSVLFLEIGKQLIGHSVKNILDKSAEHISWGSRDDRMTLRLEAAVVKD